VKIRVPRSSLPAHFRNGDLYPINGQCPKQVVKTNGKGGVLGAKAKKKRGRGVGHFTG
jgi:hypothetical protein